VLYTVDNTIQKTEEIMKQTERIRDGVLQHHFSRKKGDIEGDADTYKVGPKTYNKPTSWKISKIGAIGEVVTGDTPSTSDEDNFGGKIPFVTGKEFQGVKYVEQGERSLTEKGAEKVHPVPEGSVMMDCIGMDLGKVAIAEVELATNQQVNSIVVDEEEIDSEYLYYYLKFISPVIKSQAGRTRTPIVKKSQFSEFKVVLPPILEQKEIAESIAIYDEKLAHQVKYKSQLNRLKRGLMQDLLSGSVRTTDADIEVLPEVAQHG
jgi:type I restriction enzyme S subunit